jgi:hypothetical protein
MPLVHSDISIELTPEGRVSKRSLIFDLRPDTNEAPPAYCVLLDNGNGISTIWATAPELRAWCEAVLAKLPGGEATDPLATYRAAVADATGAYDVEVSAALAAAHEKRQRALTAALDKFTAAKAEAAGQPRALSGDEMLAAIGVQCVKRILAEPYDGEHPGDILLRLEDLIAARAVPARAATVMKSPAPEPPTLAERLRVWEQEGRALAAEVEPTREYWANEMRHGADSAERAAVAVE